MKSLEQVVLFKVDAEKGEGVELSDRFSVRGYPTYVLLNTAGETIDRWSGYQKAHFISMLSEAVADPTNIAEKVARFKKTPNAKDAEKIARFYGTKGEHAKAVEFARLGADLEPTPESRLAVVEGIAMGMHDKAFSVDELEKERDLLLATKTQDPEILTQLVSLLGYGGREAEKPEIVVPALGPTIAATANSTDPGMQAKHQALLIEKALLVDKDKSKAYELKLASMPEGWKDDGQELNGFAWWCFENKVNLPQAEELARRGTTLVVPGSDRAMVYDTLAEILFAQGKKAEAIAAAEQAVRDDPKKELYVKQLERFKANASGTN